MMREIVQSTIASEADMTVVGVVESDDTLADAVERTDADVVILALASPDEIPAYDALLYRHPRLHLLAMVDDARGALLSELRPHRASVGDVSPAGLVDAIRASVRAEAS